MDMTEFGRRIRQVREQILEMTQTELAGHLNMSQAIYSRAEGGVGGSLLFVFTMLNFLHARNLRAHRLFREPFDVAYLRQEATLSVPDERAFELISELKDHARADLEKTIVLLEMMAQRHRERSEEGDTPA
jgi:transcriptional regulator with XRE-family HTH domain